jgi:catechol 2,3-dioxygenase-like lactoylglutathione lyase family enzyme
MNDVGAVAAGRLVRFSLITHNRQALADFYESAFGFRREAAGRYSAARVHRELAATGAASSITIALGAERIELIEFDAPGEAYPAAQICTDLNFQHFALVVPNIAAVHRRLLAMTGWSPISRAGPEQLPSSSGGVTAFKFRDPEGHPLELLEFPTGSVPLRWRTAHRDDLCLGIDHSAISVRDTACSVAFYRALGLRETQHTVNQGPEQDRLDALSGACVEVTALSFAAAGPHLELLCYRSPGHLAGRKVKNNAVAATRLVLQRRPVEIEFTEAFAQPVVDPDGHHLLMQAG